jgi:hypothetical protein|tara:strand:+ start:1260 stop:1460 length:201 start_codon:yes stop_codon:yes gene_type:complete
MTTKQDVADYINHKDTYKDLTPAELAHMQERIDPYLADILIKFVGDVSWLVEIRDNMSREVTNRKF